MIIIEITESNYQNYLDLDIVAFSFAFDGAMGEGGGIYIVGRDGQIYHANYYRGIDCIDTIHIKDVIPVFDDIKFGLFGNISNNSDWISVYLGYGNHLVLVNELSDDFRKKVEDAHYKFYGELFQYWPGFVLDLLGKEKGDLTMNDIWAIVYPKE